MKRLLVIVLALALGCGLGMAILELPDAAVDLRPLVRAQLAASGVAHPVTAVLLNFRGYDTLLEIAVLLLALFALLAQGLERHRAPGRLLKNVAEAAEARQKRPEKRSLRGVNEHFEAVFNAASATQVVFQQPASPAAPMLPLSLLARVASPPLLVVALYLLWAGAWRPGGAFQAGAVLAAGAVLLHLTGVLPGWVQPRAALRWGLVGGFLVFLGVAAALLAGAGLLEYPPDWAGSLILLIESALTLSLGLILGGLFLFMSCDEDQP